MCKIRVFILTYSAKEWHLFSKTKNVLKKFTNLLTNKKRCDIIAKSKILGCRQAVRHQTLTLTLPGFESLHPSQIRNSRLIQSYRPTVFFLSLKIDRKSLIYKGFFAFVVHFGICGAYILSFQSPKIQKSTTPRQGVVPSYR